MALRRVPIVAIRGSVMFPHTDTLLSFGREKSVAAVNAAFNEDRVIAIFSQKDPRTPDPAEEDLYKMGTIATITQMMSTDGEIHAIVKGHSRVRLEEIVTREPYLSAKVVEISEKESDSPEIKPLAKQLLKLFKKAINFGKQAEITTVIKLVSGQVEPIELVDQISSLLEIKPSEKQKLLETPSVKKRLKKVLEYLAQEVNVLEIEKTISAKTQKRFEGQMRKAMLREKKKTIEEELGEEGELTSSEEVVEFRKKIRRAKMPKEVKKRAE